MTISVSITGTPGEKRRILSRKALARRKLENTLREPVGFRFAWDRDPAVRRGQPCIEVRVREPENIEFRQLRPLYDALLQIFDGFVVRIFTPAGTRMVFR